MDHPIRILGIAPYEGMKTLMASLAESYPEVELRSFVGDLEQGLEIAQDHFHGDYDVVISRGGTAHMLRKHLTIPVIEIETSAYDILCSLKLANGLTGKTAVVSYVSITASARMLCDLMGYNMDIYTIETSEDAERVLSDFRPDEYQSILCDMVSNTVSKRLGIETFLVVSGVDSIRKALEQAILLCNSQQHLREENLFFRDLIQGQIGQTVVFDSEGRLFLSTLSGQDPELLDMLRRELPESQQEAERRITRNLHGLLYAIRARRITTASLSYTAFFFDARKTPLSPNQVGIRFYTRPEAEAAYYNSIFSFAGAISASQEEIDRLSQSAAPVMVAGEDGTGKETVVSMLYIRGALKNAPLISINCSLLNDKSWLFLLEHHNSPLSDEGNSIYFASIDVLPQERRQQLLAALAEMDVCRRNRVFFSCVCQPGEPMTAVGSLFMDKLGCVSLSLPPLRKMAHRIPMLVNLTLSHLNVDLPRQILGAEPAAIELLQNFQWPHNYTQFRRVLGELAITADGSYIAAEDVRQVLRKERHVGAFSSRAENAALPLDLNRTLSDIDRDVARRVLDETGGNQTAAAKRLGISRTTLWRLLQK